MSDGPDIISWAAPRQRCFNHCEWTETETPGIFTGIVEVPVPEALRGPYGVRPCNVIDADTGELLSPTDAVDRRGGWVRRLVDKYGKPGLWTDPETHDVRRIIERRRPIVVPRVDGK